MLHHKILFLDDDIRDTEAIAKDLVELANRNGHSISVNVFDPVQLTDHQLAEVCSDPDLSLVLIDRVLARRGSAQQILIAKLHDTSPARPAATYLMSGRDIPAEVAGGLLAEWRRQLGSHFDFRGILAKPLAAELLLGLVQSATRDANSDDGLDELLFSCSLPARLLDVGRRPIRVNDYWDWGNNVPPATVDDDGRDFVINPPRPGSTRGVVAYRISALTASSRRELQIAFPFDHNPAETFSIILSTIYSHLHQIGFTRMRYYRLKDVPGSDGVIQLERWFGEPRPQWVGTWAKAWRKNDSIYSPLEGYLAQRLARYRTLNRPKEFVFSVVHRSVDLPAEDDGLSFWNSVAGTNATEEWLEFPILCRMDSINSDGAVRGHRPYGLIVADRYGQPVTIIDKVRIENRSQTFRAHCVALARLLESELARKYAQSLNSSRRFFLENVPVMSEANVFGKYLHTVAEESRRAAGADIAAISWLAPNSSRALIRAVSPSDEALQIFPDAQRLTRRYLRDVDAPLMASAIQQKEPIFRPDGLRPEDIGYNEPDIIISRFAVPLRVGDRIIGSIGFIDRRRRRFDQSRVNRVMHLADDCAVMIDNLGASEFRREWEDSIMHEVGTLAVAAQMDVQEALKGNAQNRDLLGASWSLDLLLDRNLAFRRLRGKSIDAGMREIEPRGMLERELQHASVFAARKKRELVVSFQGDGRARIWASDVALGFVVRTIVDNAVHHGEGPVIDVVEDKDELYWTLTVSNDGQMTIDENRLKFEPYAHVPNRRRDGSHVALAASRNWAESYGALLTVENGNLGEKKLVVATLRWPLCRND